MSQPWFQSSIARLLVDMHIPDWDTGFLRDFDAEVYAGRMVESGVDTVEIYAGSCLGLCNWPTRIGYRHASSGARDLLGSVIKACRARGLQVVLYLNVWSRKAYDEHPEWRMIFHSGKGSVEHQNGRFGLCCPNTGFGDYFVQLVRELNCAYDGVGLWIDMIGWFNVFCYCPACQERYTRETGYGALPRTIDWQDPAWNAFRRCRERWLAEFAAAIRAAIKRDTPERSLALQCSTWLAGWGGGASEEFLRQNDYLAADLYGDQYEQSYICKLFRAFSRQTPIEFMVPRCENLAHHTTTRSRWNLAYRSYAALANQASFTLIDAIDPAGTLEGGFYKLAGELNRNLHRYGAYLAADSQMLAEVAIYCDPASLINVDRSPLSVADFQYDVTAHDRLINLVRSLQEAHYTVTFVGQSHLEELDQYTLVILSDMAFINAAAGAAFTRYVENGGTLWATGNSSLYDDMQGRRPDFLLAELFGVHYAGETRKPVSYIRPGDGTPPITLESGQPRIRAQADCRILGTAMLAYSAPEELQRFGSAISNPPEVDTGEAAWVCRNFGGGRVMYCAGVIEQVRSDFHRDWIRATARELLGEDTMIHTNAPASMEIIVFRQPSKRRFVVSLLNFTSQLPAAPWYDIDVALTLPELPELHRVVLAPERQELRWQRQGHTVCFTLPCMEGFALVSLEENIEQAAAAAEE